MPPQHTHSLLTIRKDSQPLFTLFSSYSLSPTDGKHVFIKLPLVLPRGGEKHQINQDLANNLHPSAVPHSHTHTQTHTPFPGICASYAARRVKINVTAEPYCALPLLSTSFIHRRVIGSQFELPLCLLWAHFALTECGRLMATSSRGRLASASMSALNSLHQFPPVLRSPTRTHERRGGGREEKNVSKEGGKVRVKKERKKTALKQNSIMAATK